MGPSDARPRGDALIPDARKTQLSATETVQAASFRAVFTRICLPIKNSEKLTKISEKNIPFLSQRKPKIIKVYYISFILN